MQIKYFAENCYEELKQHMAHNMMRQNIVNIFVIILFSILE